MKQKQNQKGFTLIELLVVIGIIALLSSIAVFSLNSARGKSRDAKRFGDVKQIATALELFYDDSSSYHDTDNAVLVLGESSATCLQAADSNGSTGGFVASCTSGRTVYMKLVPKDPLSDSSHEYQYVSSAGGGDYSIKFVTEGSVGGFPKGTICVTPSGTTSSGEGGTCPLFPN